MTTTAPGRVASTYHSIVERAYGMPVVIIAAAIALIAGIVIGVGISALGPNNPSTGLGSLTSVGSDGEPRQGGR